MPNKTQTIPITGYADKLSVRPGDHIAFKVSSYLDTTFHAKLRRVISADPNPDGQGIVEQPCDQWFTPSAYPSRVQQFHPGSYAVSEQSIAFDDCLNVRFGARVLVKKVLGIAQTIVSIGNLQLGLNASGVPFCEVENQKVFLGNAIATNTWLSLEVSVEANSGTIELQSTVIDKHKVPNKVCSRKKFTEELNLLSGKFYAAARQQDDEIGDHFSGKIEAPYLQCVSSDSSIEDFIQWDFSCEIPSTKVIDISQQENHGKIVNYPTRGVTGSLWTGEEMSWQHMPAHYAAIHFHADDIYDFGWDADFTFHIPDGMPSGMYAMYLESEGHQDTIPFVVCAPHGKPAAKLCVIIPTFTYAIYGNHARPDYHSSWEEKISRWKAYPNNPANHREYGLSTYNNHLDGSGICHASHLRPLFNLRPGYLTFGYGEDSGLRHLQADTHLISWLHHHEIEYDLITDYEIHQDGESALAGYQTVMTTTHPEYHTYESLDGIQKYTQNGGNLMYLGGNGFYWRVALHPENPNVLEIRRAEDGIRAWAAEPGEYYSAFDGGYGGLWRRLGRPPQQLTGVGFTAQGNFHGSYYRRKNFDPEMQWVFEGIKEEVIGNHGLSGGGAAGFELDRMDFNLGTPADAVLLASSEGHQKDFVLVPEEQLTHLTNTAGKPVDQILRADLVYFSLPGGGQVFSVGSITFCGSLPTNHFDNDVSTVLKNVLARFND